MVVGGSLLVFGGVGRIEFFQGGTDGFDGFCPEGNIKPHMRIVKTALTGEEPICRQVLGQGTGGLASSQTGQGVGQFAFQMQTGIADQVGPFENSDVAG